MPNGELLIKVEPGASYEDGDCVCAFNALRSGCTHVQSICHPWQAGIQNKDRYIGQRDTHIEKLQQIQNKRKYERKSKWVMTETDLDTNQTEEVTAAKWSITAQGFAAADVSVEDNVVELRKEMKRLGNLDSEGRPIWNYGPDSYFAVAAYLKANGVPADSMGMLVRDSGPHGFLINGLVVPVTAELLTPRVIDLPVWLARRRKHRNPSGGTKRPIFGDFGSEVFYARCRQWEQQMLNKAWQAVQQHTPNREADEEFTLWPMGRLDIRSYLAVRTDDFNLKQLKDFTEPLYQVDGNGDFVLDQHGEKIVNKRRRHKVNWEQDVLGDVGETASNVRDRDRPVGKEPTYRGVQNYRSKDQRSQNVRIGRKKDRP